MCNSKPQVATSRDGRPLHPDLIAAREIEDRRNKERARKRGDVFKRGKRACGACGHESEFIFRPRTKPLDAPVSASPKFEIEAMVEPAIRGAVSAAIHAVQQATGIHAVDRVVVPIDADTAQARAAANRRVAPDPITLRRWREAIDVGSPADPTRRNSLRELRSWLRKMEENI